MKHLVNLAILIAASGYTYGTTPDGQPFWQQCNPDGYCFGRAGRGSEDKPFWFQQPADKRDL